jgi:hypothetical protein
MLRLVLGGVLRRGEVLVVFGAWRRGRRGVVIGRESFNSTCPAE